MSRILIIGSCLAGSWPAFVKSVQPNCVCDFLLMNNAPQFPENMPAAPEDYDFQLIQIPLRTLLPEPIYFGLSYSDYAAYEALFENAKQRLKQYLENAMRWNVEHGILTFVHNFLVPQQNSLGRLLPRYDLRNFTFLVESLNQFLASELVAYRNAYLFDFDQIVATFGRKYIQDDSVYHTGHGSALSAFDWSRDQSRLEPVKPIHETYPLQTGFILSAAWVELMAMVRTIRQVDAVKLVILDIDDTIWRGVALEEGDVSSHDAIEGWPMGFIEALQILKRRGVLLALVSKNTEELLSAAWKKRVGRLIQLADFAARKINWRPKAENIQEILSEVNLLPRNTVFIDDNPVEREGVRSAFPDIRTFGPNPYVWRRLLLWSAETQVTAITAESANRTHMVQAQVERQTHQKQLSREDFLTSLELEVTLFLVDGVEDKNFTRVFELLNKTNQFNTTGKRWAHRELYEAMRGGMEVYAFRATDKFTEYGIVGIVLMKGMKFEQFVMSCRVVGMEVELAVMARLLMMLRDRGYSHSEAVVHETSVNLLSRDLYSRSGFKRVDASLSFPLSSKVHVPTHVTIHADFAAGEQFAA